MTTIADSKLVGTARPFLAMARAHPQLVDTAFASLVFSSLSTSRSGNGLVEMRERIEAYNGRLTAGPRPGGGYQVHARFPIKKNSNVPRVRFSEVSQRQEAL